MSLRLAAEQFELFSRQYTSEEDCVRALFQAKWPEGFRCPRCAHDQFYLISSRRLPLYECRSCRTQTSLIVGTIMEGSRTPLRSWFQAIYLHTQDLCINALQLSEKIGVTYKTAWLICHKIRHAMNLAESKQLLTGIVRVSDAVYCKRLTTYMDWHKQEQHLLVGSTDSATGDIDQLKIKHQNKQTLKDKYDCTDPAPFILQNVDPLSASQVIFTRRIGRTVNVQLTRVGYNVTWWLGRLFRGIGPKHLQAYLDLYCYLFNRNQSTLFDSLLSDCAMSKKITYRDLICKQPIIRSIRPQRTQRELLSTTG